MKKPDKPMKHINVNDQPEHAEHVRAFFLSLDLDPDGSIVELDGKQFQVSQVPEPLTAEDVAAVERGIAQMEAGEMRPFEDVDADIRKEFGFQSPQ